MFRKIVGVIIVVVATVAIAGVGLAIYFNSAPDTTTQAQGDERVAVSIAKGENLDGIARKLEDEGLIRSSLFLRAYSKLVGTEQSIQQGNYAMNRGMTTVQIHDLLVSGKQVLIKVTVPEGFTTRMIGALLEEKKIVSQKDFSAAVSDPAVLKNEGIDGSTAEGYLYPDTYLFTEDTPAYAVVHYMIENFRNRMDEAAPSWRDLSPKELQERITLASIVEREYVTPSEAPLMASVFYNRLKIGKALESCATVVYVMTEQYGMPHPSRLFYRDLDIKSAYNTYRTKGLPPGAISNPGSVALKAAFEPAKSDYLYFVLKGPEATQHHFSKTFAEHDQASVFYLKG